MLLLALNDVVRFQRQRLANGIFGEVFGIGPTATLANAQDDQQTAAQTAEGHGNQPVQANPPRAGLLPGPDVLLGLIRPTIADVLAKVIVVAGFQYGEKKAPQSAEPESPRSGPGGADLKIDQVRPAIVANDDVLALVQIHVGNAPLVHVLQQHPQLGKELIVNRFAGPQRMAWDIFMGD